jgi:hypothetical protein
VCYLTQTDRVLRTPAGAPVCDPASACHSGRMGNDERPSKNPATVLPVDELVRLGEAAVTELERRGYEVRGKTAAQIKKILRFPPPKRVELNDG